MSDYEIAWKELIESFGGALDGIEWSIDNGSHDAIPYSIVYREIQKMIDEIAKKYNINGVWE